MTTACATSKIEALRLLDTSGLTSLDLAYESGWRDAIALSRIGDKRGIRVEYRGHEDIAVSSPAALVAGLSRPKLTFRQRNLYCHFDLSKLPASDLEPLEAKATMLGDYVLAGHLMREVDAEWTD
ncbi:PHA-granule associated protein 4 [Cupriavidus sp. WKF15]|uniref:PHA-granule associated protein 4 n=1 Tax=Cupriavidus sp. WKF15 TaxID=3032282 RepID=UPI0023E0FFFF|nr:PHA-granule associated protein 4 [Cupriavidus sp. WKF15]WER50416.1 PHA-granule associated protein 4 [Cupriavidus sp. WKF15]